MPGVDFARLRAEITMEQVLALIEFEPSQRTGDQWYGSCPLPDCASDRGRAFSVNVSLGRYYCHRCHCHGNALELWSAFTEQSLHPATIDLCRKLGRHVPWLQRW